ncbi:MAG: hypothetical protein ACRCV5_19000 [Afipia sp.]
MNMKTVASEMEARRDTWTAMLVDMAVRMDKKTAPYFMASQGVPMSVAKRVLLRPEQRRAA